MKMNLVEKFPYFSFAFDADKFLENFKNNQDIVFQLRSQRIYKVEFVPLISNGGLGIRENGDFFIFFNDLLSDDELAHTLGHELGHTFHFYTVATLPEEKEEQIEKFCDMFSELWLKQVGKENIVYRIENERKMFLSSIY